MGVRIGERDFVRSDDIRARAEMPPGIALHWRQRTGDGHDCHQHCQRESVERAGGKRAVANGSNGKRHFSHKPVFAITDFVGGRRWSDWGIDEESQIFTELLKNADRRPNWLQFESNPRPSPSMWRVVERRSTREERR
jgi:hypothetical protein